MDRRSRIFYGIGLLVVVVFAVVVSQFASDNPDGLEYVAEQQGFSDAAENHTLGDAPLADYGENLTDNSALNTAVAGLAGVVVTLAVGYGIFWLARRRSSDHSEPSSSVK
jgi:ABC-type Fe3+ transport system permease subunit